MESDPLGARFQSAPLLRGAIRKILSTKKILKFQSAPLLRGAIIKAVHHLANTMFQSAPLLRGAITVAEVIPPAVDVSIRAPLARGDLLHCNTDSSSHCFNPRPSCEGR